MKNFQQNFFFKIVIVLLLTVFITLPFRTNAQAVVTDPISMASAIGRWISDNATLLYEKVIKRAGNIAYKNALRTFMSQVAYDTATRLVEGDWGKSPLYSTQNFGNFMQSVGETTLVDTLDVLGKDNGFMEFDVCNPTALDLKATISMGLYDSFTAGSARTKARCTWSEIATNWDQWVQTTGRNLSSEAFLKNLQDSFSPNNSQIGTYLTIQGNVAEKLAIGKEVAALNRVATKGMKDVTAPISGFIKTPAVVSEEAVAQLGNSAAISQPEMVSTGDILADALGIFTNTLASKLMKKLFDKGLADVAASRDILVYNWANAQTYNAGTSMAGLVAMQFSTNENEVGFLALMGQCQNANNPGPFDCVIKPPLVTAIENRMSVKEAIIKKYLTDTGFFGFKASNDPLASTDYLDNLPYRSLVILRTQRIIPVTWELAALYWDKYDRSSGKLTLNRLIHCFEDSAYPNDNKLPLDCKNEALGFNPYYHLVDPNWILKFSGSVCEKKGSGYNLINSRFECENNVAGTTLKSGTVAYNDAEAQFKSSNGALAQFKSSNGALAQFKSSIVQYPACEKDKFENPDKMVLKVQRDDQYCADRKSCLREGDNGQCLANSWGYCLKEEPIWRLDGKTCPAQNDTCESFKRDSDGNQFAYLRNTLQSCSSADGGCWWYSTVRKASRQAPVLDEKGNQVTEQLFVSDPVTGEQMPYDSPVFETKNDWSDQDRIYLNKNVTPCSYGDAGCTKLSRMLFGTNLVFNGDFSDTTEANGINIGWFNTNCEKPWVRDFLTLKACTIETAGSIPVDYNFTYVLSADLNGDGYIQLDNALRKYSAEELNIGVDVNFSADVKQVKVKIIANAVAEFSMTADNVQLIIKKSPITWHNGKEPLKMNTYQVDYSQNNEYGRQYLKVAPSYLGCGGYNQVINRYINSEDCENAKYTWRVDLNRCVLSGSAECKNFATQCKASELGCQSFTPTNGGLNITGAPREADYCPDKCVGYESYLEKPTKFAVYASSTVPVRMVNFIPKTAKQCTATESGCEEFTNLDSSTAGGESLEYFTDFRQCVPQDSSNITAYYTWEGSDTAGYELKKWEFLKTNLADGAPCLNLVLGSSECKDDTANIVNKKCSATEFQAGTNISCREFFNVAGKKFYILQDKPIIASTQCRAYRRTIDNDIYNVDLTLSSRCSASVNGCREYKGNQSNNQKTIFNDTFEDGEIGGWVVSGNSLKTAGLEYSTEALNQGGHSLKINASSASSVYRNISLTTGKTKEYQVFFWAKKDIVVPPPEPSAFAPTISFNPIPTVHAQTGTATTGTGNTDTGTDATLAFDFDSKKLNEEWQLFTTDKIPLTAVQADGVVALNLKNSAGTTIYLDNIILKESADIFYVIKDSWQMPKDANGKSICDDPFVGAQLGCQQYKDLGNNDYYLKSLNSLCSASAIGCEGYINTQNSTLQGTKDVKDGICNKDNGVIKNAVGSNGEVTRCYINNRLMCQMKELNGPSCSYMKEWTVPNDEMIYLVNDKSKECKSDKQGCSAVGKPEFDRKLENYLNKSTGLDTVDFVKDYQDIYLINNPDTYDTVDGQEGIACSESGLFCTGFNGELSAQKYYYDPQGFNNNGVDLSRTCYFKNNRWYETGSNPEKLCNGQADFTILKANDPSYTGWVATCDAKDSTCTEIRDPKTTAVGIAERCDAQISPYLSGVCTGGVAGNYCVKSINGVNHNVCEIQVGKNTCNYNAYGWQCVDPNNVGKNRACKINEIKVCDIEAGKTACAYSLVCKSDYYLKNTLTAGGGACQTDGGKINEETGCLLFYDSEKASLGAPNNSTYATKKGQQAQGCTGTDNFTNNAYCNANVTYGVIRDRQCAEWLECSSSMEADVNNVNKEVCTGLARCLQADGEGNCVKLASDSQPTDIKLSGDDQNQIENLRYLSGFSRPTVSWINKDINKVPNVILGRLSPEEMKQVGNKLEIANGGFEEFNDNSINSWEIPEGNTAYQQKIRKPYADHFCQATQDGTRYHNGNFSLNLYNSEANNGIGCFYESKDYYEVEVDKEYILSFYAQSSTGDQHIRVKLECSKPYGEGEPVLLGSLGSNEVLKIDNKDKWQKFTLKYKVGNGCSVNEDTTAVKIVFQALSSAWGGSVTGNIWIDDVAVEPALDSTGTEGFIPKDCRLYPNPQALSCSYTTDMVYRGWNGYCLDPDPAYQVDPKNPNDYQRCLQWYPLDILAGDDTDIFSKEDKSKITYTGDRPLYYCLQNNDMNEGDNLVESFTSTPFMTKDGCDSRYYTNFFFSIKNGDYELNDQDVFHPKIYLDDLIGMTFDVPERVNIPRNISFIVEDWKNKKYDVDEPVGADGNYFIKTKTQISSAAGQFAFEPCGPLTPCNGWEGSQVVPTSEYVTEAWVFYPNQEGKGGSSLAYKPYVRKCLTNARNDMQERDYLWIKLFIANAGKGDYIETAVVQYADNSNVDVEDTTLSGKIIYKDLCETFAQVVDNKGEPKAYLGRYNYNSWITPSGFGKNLSAHSMWENGGGMLLSYGGFKQPDQPWILPSNWDTTQVPLSVFNGGSFGGYAGLPLSASVKKSVCITGNKISVDCVDSEECKDENNVLGICGGIGDKYCYNYAGITNGQKCTELGVEKGGCPRNNTCNTLKLNGSIKSAYDNLQQLFVKINSVWVWDRQNGKYRECVTTNDSNVLNDCGLRDSLLDNSKSSGVAKKPEVKNAELSVTTVPAIGGKVSLGFFALINDNQLPLKKISIDWGDGSGNSLIDQTPNSFIRGDVYEGIFSGGDKKFYHWYNCVPDSFGRKCLNCFETDPKTGKTTTTGIPDENGVCTYTVKVTITDNWDSFNSAPAQLQLTVGSSEISN